jgi:hypothetical protein
MPMSADILRFPMRCAACVWLVREGSGWLVVVREHGWIFGDRRSALADARWLARNFDLPLREGVQPSRSNSERVP